MGAGRITRFKVTAGGRTREYRNVVADGAEGTGGLFEQMFATRVPRAIYADELKRLDAYAREHRSA